MVRGTGPWVAFLSALVASTGCAARVAPYHFRGPLIAGVAAEELLPPMGRATPSLRQQPSAPAGPSAERVADKSTLIRSLVIDPGDSLVAHLRSLVGARDESLGPVEFAVAALRGIGEAVDADLAGTRSGVDLVRLAQSRDAWGKARAPTLGDLLVFDRSDDTGSPASAIGVVIRTDRRGVSEYLYLQRQVIRRGFVDPKRPHLRRDEHQRVVNTHLRAGQAGDPKDTAYLSGELLSGVIALERLLPR